MKNTIIKLATAAALLLFCCASALAQQATGTKSKLDHSTVTPPDLKSTEPTPAPQPAASEKKEEQVKPIVPGGIFRPVETAVPAAKARVNDVDKHVPIIPPANAVKPVAKETGTGTAAKPAPVLTQQIIKEQ